MITQNLIIDETGKQEITVLIPRDSEEVSHIIAIKCIRKFSNEAVENITVRITNSITNDILDGSTNSNGEIEFDCLNFPNGYKLGDNIIIEVEI